MKLNTLLSAALLAAFVVPAFAQTATPVIHARQQNQEKRIENGVNSGQMTAKETLNAERREAKIQSDKHAAKADGVVTKAERRNLNRELDKSSKKIHHAKHNAKVS